MKLLVVDGNSILNRAYYGVRALTNKDGVFTNAIFGFFNMLLAAVKDTGADTVAVAFDSREKTFRHKAVASYKANRHGMPEELAMQMPYTQEILEALGIVTLTCPGWEADDILGTVAAVAEREQTECILLTGDRDSFQLISPHVSVRYASNREAELYDEAKFREVYGFPPQNLTDLKGLMGDASDNISGVKGIGEKTARKLLLEFGTVEALYAALPDPRVKGATEKNLLAGKAEAEQSKWLATIVRDAPVPQTLSEYAQKPRQTQRLAQILTELELFQLMEKLRVNEADAPAEQEPAAADVQFTAVTLSEAEFEELCTGSTPAVFLLHGETLDIAWGEKLTAVSEKARILRFLNAPVPKRTFHAKPVYRFCLAEGETLCGLTFDAAIAAYLLNSSEKEYVISQLCANEKLPFDAARGPQAEIAALPALCDRLEQRVQEQGMERLLQEIELPLIEVLAEMEHTGVLLHAEGVRAFGEMLDSEIAERQQDIWRLAGHEFNILSTKQLGTVLFEELEIPPGKKTKTGYSTDQDTLEKRRDAHPIVPLVMEYRHLTKLKSTYVTGLLSKVQPDGRIHTLFRQTETTTGRISSIEPNLQNIPVRTELGREMRRFFTAGEGNILLDADYSQIELRIVAHLCGDENMIRAFTEERDIHRMTAAKVFDMPEEMVTKEMRTAAKAVNFGILYGMGPYSLAQDIGTSFERAKKYIREYLHSFPRVEQFMQDTVKSAKEQGYVTTMFGRRRYIRELSASSYQTHQFGERAAMNAPIQGTAADIIKLAMVRVWQRLRTEVPEAKLILQIHDELIVEAPMAVADRAAEILHEEMTGVCKLSVPLVAEVQRGKTWYDAKG